MLTTTVAGFAAGTPLWGQAPLSSASSNPPAQDYRHSGQRDHLTVPRLQRQSPLPEPIRLPVRTVYIVRTDTGMEGYGEKWDTKTPEDLSSYLDTTPFDWFGSTHSMPMSMALYDLIGKILVFLCGSCWVHRFASGFLWLPGRSLSLPRPWPRRSGRSRPWLPLAQVPRGCVSERHRPDWPPCRRLRLPGFKIHYDFNADSELAAVYPVLRELEKFPVAGEIEDPINVEDHEAWKSVTNQVFPAVDLPLRTGSHRVLCPPWTL